MKQCNDPARPQFRVLLTDSVSAFLLTFEAVLQFVKAQFKLESVTINFEEWLIDQPQYAVYVKGLRTLRHFEAHIEKRPVPQRVRLMIHVGQASTITDGKWHFFVLQPTDLKKLRKPELAAEDLDDWNNLADNYDVGEIFKQSLQRLREILVTAEQFLSIHSAL